MLVPLHLVANGPHGIIGRLQPGVLHGVLEVVVRDPLNFAGHDSSHVIPVNELAEVVVSLGVYLFLYSEHLLDRTRKTGTDQEVFLVVPVRDDREPGVVEHYPHDGTLPRISARR